MAAPQYDPKCDSFLSVTSSGQAFRPTTSEALTLTPPTTNSLGHHHVPSHLPMFPPDHSGSMETRINTALSHPTYPASSSTSHPAPAVNPSVSRRLMSQWLERKESNWDSLDRKVQDRVDQAEYMLVAGSDGSIKLDDLFICSSGETFAGPSDRQWGTNQSQYRRINIQAPEMVAILSGIVQTDDLPTMSEQDRAAMEYHEEVYKVHPSGQAAGHPSEHKLEARLDRGLVYRHRAT